MNTYINPVIRGYYPDPSICAANGHYYVVCSTNHYFPGIPLFESEDLVNWEQIGYVLTRKSQLPLEGVQSSGGIMAPTIRYHEGRFYVACTNGKLGGNFYVWTDDIRGEWSEPVMVAQRGIDASLMFENGKAYFLTNGPDDEDKKGITQCEINIETGEKLTASKVIWQGTGGRCLESPHMYHIGDTYYLVCAEGGTEYGHMITCARASDPWGPFVSAPVNPVLTNRNKTHQPIQGIGHGDLIQDEDGNWHFVCLGFRQIHSHAQFHTLGREVFLIPARFDENGCLTAGYDGTADYEYECKAVQKFKKEWTFANTNWKADWCFLRDDGKFEHELTDEYAVLTANGYTLNDVASPAFVAMRQKDFDFTLTADVEVEGGEGGVCVYNNEFEHFDLAICKGEVFARINFGGIDKVLHSVPAGDKARLVLTGDHAKYHFFVEIGGQRIPLGDMPIKYISKEVCGGFVGAMLALYAQNGGKATFRNFRLEYEY